MFTRTYKQPTGIVSSVSSIAVSTAVGAATVIRGGSQIASQLIDMGLNELYATDASSQLQNLTEFLPNKLEALKSLKTVDCEDDEDLLEELRESIATLKAIKMKRV